MHSRPAAFGLPIVVIALVAVLSPPIRKRFMKTGIKYIVAIGVILSLIMLRLPAANAWQYGADTGSSSGAYGIRSQQQVDGSVPSSYFIGAVSAMTDTSSIWHAIALLDQSAGGSIETEGEYNDGNYHDYVMCTGLSTGTYYTSQIYWDSSSGGWRYKNTSVATCNSYLVVESGTPTVNSGGSVDMMESTDTTANDFNSLAAWTAFDGTLQYQDSGGSWHYSSTYDVHNNAAVSSVGNSYDCTASPPYIIVWSSSAPPSSDGTSMC